MNIKKRMRSYSLHALREVVKELAPMLSKSISQKGEAKMKPDCLILRFGELTLKGKNRKRFERSVMTQIRKVLGSFPDLRYIPEFGRVYVELGGAAYEEASAALQRVFGLASFSPAYHAPMEVEAIQEMALRMMQALA